jgi:hypothetical protein
MQHIGNQSSADIHQSILLSDEKVRLPEPSYTVLDSYNISDAPPRPNAYIRYVMFCYIGLQTEIGFRYQGNMASHY